MDTSRKEAATVDKQFPPPLPPFPLPSPPSPAPSGVMSQGQYWPGGGTGVGGVAGGVVMQADGLGGRIQKTNRQKTNK